MRLDTGGTPTPEMVKEARLNTGLTQGAACEVVHLKNTARWSEYETGERNMDSARWELFLVKTGQHPDFIRRKSPGRKTNEVRLERSAVAHA